MDNFRYQQTAFGGIREDVGDTYHARDSLNMLTDYGRVRKRHGYRQTLSFERAVRWVGSLLFEGLGRPRRASLLSRRHIKRHSPYGVARPPFG